MLCSKKLIQHLGERFNFYGEARLVDGIAFAIRGSEYVPIQFDLFNSFVYYRVLGYSSTTRTDVPNTVNNQYQLKLVAYSQDPSIQGVRFAELIQSAIQSDNVQVTSVSLLGEQVFREEFGTEAKLPKVENTLLSATVLVTEARRLHCINPCN